MRLTSETLGFIGLRLERQYNMGKNTFKLESTPNFRDLGGYYSSFGGHVKEGALYRSNSLAMLSDDDIKLILEKGIRTVIDLRTDFEIYRGQSRLSGVEGVGYYKVSLIDNVHSQDHKTFEKNMPKSMAELYKNLLDNSSQSIVKVFDIILENSDKAVVFNCTAGKDRTGVIAALILDLLRCGQRRYRRGLYYYRAAHGTGRCKDD